MKKFLQNKKLFSVFTIIIIILILLAGSVSLRNKRNSPLFVQSFGNDVAGLGARIIAAPVQWISGGFTNVQDLLQAEDENNYLKKQVDDLSQTKARNSALSAENRQLRAALKLRTSLTGYDTVTASVISRSPDTWSDLLIINRGTSAGIQKNMAVMCGGGVIGRVIEANAASSKVELITTTDSSANRFAVEADTHSGNKIHGIITDTASGSLAFTQVVDARKLTKGTRVYTSGMGGNSPKGLLVGTVSATTRDSYGLSNVIRIKPAGELNDPSVVTVVKRRVSD